MGHVTFTNTSSITVRASTRREWVLPATGRVGTAEILLPISSPAADTSYIDKDAGSRVQIVGEDDSGTWSGYVDDIEWDQESRSVRIMALHDLAILRRYPVDSNRKFVNVAASAIVAAALRNVPMAIAGVAETPPHIEDDYWFHGESVWDHVAAMMERTNGELRVTDSGELIWGGPIGDLYGTFMLAPAQLRRARYGVSFSEQRSRVTALRDFEEYSTADGTAAQSHWAGHHVMKVSTGGYEELVAAARAELQRRRAPQPRLRASVPRAHWSLREGQLIQGCVPAGNWTGVVFIGRVMARAIDDQDDLMSIEIQGIATEELQAASPKQSFYAQMREAQRAHERGFRYLGGLGERGRA